MKKTMITLSVIVICIVIFFGYLAITKPNKMPFIALAWVASSLLSSILKAYFMNLTGTKSVNVI